MGWGRPQDGMWGTGAPCVVGSCLACWGPVCWELGPHICMLWSRVGLLGLPVWHARILYVGVPHLVCWGSLLGFRPVQLKGPQAFDVPVPGRASLCSTFRVRFPALQVIGAPEKEGPPPC